MLREDAARHVQSFDDIFVDLSAPFRPLISTPLTTPAKVFRDLIQGRSPGRHAGK